MADLSCQDFIEFLDDYVDQSQAQEVRATFEQHLEACPMCVEYLKTYRDTIELARGACGEDELLPTPDDVPEELIEIILKSRPAD